MAPASETSVRRESSRLQESGRRRVLDSATRKRLLNRKLESLEEDNHQKDPFESSDSPKKKGPRLLLAESPQKDHSNSPTLSSSKKKKKRFRGDHFKTRFRKTFNQLLDEERQRIGSKQGPSYFTAVVPPSKLPPRKFCLVCGYYSKYTCIACGAFSCSIPCLNLHRETRCLKWTA